MPSRVVDVKEQNQSKIKSQKEENNSISRTLSSSFSCLRYSLLCVSGGGAGEGGRGDERNTNDDTNHPTSKQLATSSELLHRVHRFILFPHAPRSHPIRAQGSCGDSSCMTEGSVIKRRRPKEEVKGADKLLPPKRTHQVLGTGNFSQGGCYGVFSTGLGLRRSLCVFVTASLQINDDPSTPSQSCHNTAP